ncbi:MAG TPA: hypothetical protein VLH19_02130 [Patescibacteria group bacterium]|nr:hypothetical protein [Patescibacteria group bacterium]
MSEILDFTPQVNDAIRTVFPEITDEDTRLREIADILNGYAQAYFNILVMPEQDAYIKEDNSLGSFVSALSLYASVREAMELMEEVENNINKMPQVIGH